MRMLLRPRILLLLSFFCVIPAASYAQVAVGVSIRVGPPALPVYEQPPCPGDGYLWTPGYWAYGPVGYYWVPGRVGDASASGPALDARLLGFCGRHVWLACGLLGSPRRILRRH